MKVPGMSFISEQNGAIDCMNVHDHTYFALKAQTKNHRANGDFLF